MLPKNFALIEADRSDGVGSNLLSPRILRYLPSFELTPSEPQTFGIIF
jgi:hypothetical protein